MKKFDHTKIEKKWQEKWQSEGIYKTDSDSTKPKSYVLDMFPYPSGEGLHVGHPKGYIATDVYSRFKKMSGYEVLHPMGWDAFGLPAENYAIKNKVHPRVAVEKNINTFKGQLGNLGFNYDWDREINTTDPEYYKWTQWIFLQLFKKGLAFESNEPINWCPSCQTGLANEDLESDGTCERCGSVVTKKPMRQWVLRITDYADRLLNDLSLLKKWPEHIKESQRNWIGKSEGAEIEFSISDSDEKIKVFTTRPDTLFGATYMVLSPEHELLKSLKFKNEEEVGEYVVTSANKSEIDRLDATKEKTGVELKGVKAINPANNEEIPIYIADYVLAHYGTGAIMAVPAHDERDYEFANKFGIENRTVVDEGTNNLIDSGDFTGMDSEEAKVKITESVGGKMTSTYRLNDWVFSRQRYWGEPIPIIHCEKCGPVAVPESNLPVLLPEVENYEPSGNGESPLASIEEWVNTTCPECDGPGKRETNTMPQWAGSSWYYLRFIDPKNNEVFIDPTKEKKWMPVDVYVGGDHAVRHLIYARFWHKFLFDLGVVSTEEPFERLEFLGFILAEDGRKMSKRWGNVINPDEIVKTNGADALRVYEMFMSPFENTTAWSTDGLVGAQRFLERVWKLQDSLTDTSNEDTSRELHKTIKKVGEDIEGFKFNTAIAQMMIFLNVASKGITKDEYRTFLQLLSPFAPHLTEELWREVLGNEDSIHIAEWPKYDEGKLIEDNVTIAVQISGKVRGDVEVSIHSSEEEVMAEVQKREKLTKWIEGEPKRVVFVKNRLINLVF
ncbi:leucine--tRNA ligase [Candidatus Kaiserbacteria bacterium]|nr:MAG: leucine--tRNA ligase [Candidatus Kaiserbacteria bacterium]